MLVEHRVEASMTKEKIEIFCKTIEQHNYYERSGEEKGQEIKGSNIQNTKIKNNL